MPVNTVYPNLPKNFPEEVRKARIAKGISLRKAVSALNFPNAATLSQLELGARNFTYDRAVQVRNFLEMDFELPEPDFENPPVITRNRTKHEYKTKAFLVEIDGEIIKVLTWYSMGPVQKGVKHTA